MKAKYKYVHFEDNGSGGYWCLNNKSGDILGEITYYARWKDYVFSAWNDLCVFNATCLDDISEFMKSVKADKKQMTIGG